MLFFFLLLSGEEFHVIHVGMAALLLLTLFSLHLNVDKSVVIIHSLFLLCLVCSCEFVIVLIQEALITFNVVFYIPISTTLKKLTVILRLVVFLPLFQRGFLFALSAICGLIVMFVRKYTSMLRMFVSVYL